MGGTYWYHYKINDLTDFHNVCERATTNCPLMPGQLVNVLNVPYAFSGNRSRNPSSSSTSSERRTMNPDDKFMNPRPAPAKPAVLRVSTSPVLNDFSDNDVTPLKEGSNASRFLRLPKKGSIDSYSTSPSGTLASGLRAAFKIRTARSQSPEDKTKDGVSGERRAQSAERGLGLRIEEPVENELIRPTRGLLLRSASDDAITTLSFGQHRRQRSPSTEFSTLQNLPLKDQPRVVEPLALHQSNYAHLGTLKEVSSKENTPIDDSPTSSPTRAELNLEKRLPTLPNTPSSAYPISLLGDSPQRRPQPEMQQLESHFSATTIDTEYHPLSMALKERSHFSAWTTTTGTSSIFNEESVPPLPEFPIHLQLEDQQLHSESPTDMSFITSTKSYSSISSSVSSTPSTSILDTDAEFEAALVKTRPALTATVASHIPHYSLPEYDYASQTTIKAPPEESRGRSGNPAFLPIGEQNRAKSRGDEIVHSESMQRLLNELSYLSDMIQN